MRRVVGNGQGSSVQRTAERIDDPAEKIIGNAEGKERPRGLQLRALGHPGIFGKEKDGGEILIQAHDEPLASVGKLDQLTVAGPGEAVRLYDSVPHRDDAPNVRDGRTHFRALELFL